MSLKLIFNHFFPNPIPLILSNFTQIKVINNDNNDNNYNYNKIRINYYDKLNNNTYAGYISYRPTVGQVGLFFLEKSYQNRGLGKQILLQTIEDMKKYNTTEIWAVTTENHPFWSNVFNKSFSWYEYEQLHSSVTGSGYKMKI
jgi:GNAT superfamily N-acetyltransferase